VAKEPWLKRHWPAAAHAATHRARGPPACPGLPSGPGRSARAAGFPKGGCGGALVLARPELPMPPPLAPQAVGQATSSSPHRFALGGGGVGRQRRTVVRRPGTAVG